MGFIDFTNGEVLTADQMDTVMRQGIMRFADASARDTALSAVLAEGMMAYLDDTDEVLKYDGTDWIDISGDISGVTAGTALTGGGTSGNVTLDVDTTVVQPNVITTQGDLVIGDASGDPVRLPVGSADQVLTSDGTTVSFQDAGGGGGELYAAGSHTVSKDAGYYLVETFGGGGFSADNQVLENGINNLSTFTTLGVSLFAGINWTQRTSGTSLILFEVAYGDGLFVAVGDDGTVITSPDGITWTSRTSGVPPRLYSIAYDDGLFVAVGNGGEIITSPDGITWTPRSSGTGADLEGIAYGDDLFVAVGSGGELITSPDGITWTPRSSDTGADLKDVTYGDGFWVAVSVNDGFLPTSPDGITWTSIDPGFSGVPTAVTYGNGLYVVVGNSGLLATSPDGITWTTRTSGTNRAILSIFSVPGVFVFGTDLGDVFTSTDGITWTQRSTGVTNPLRGLAYADELLVAVGNNGEIITSPAEINDSNAVLLLTELPDPIQP